MKRFRFALNGVPSICISFCYLWVQIFLATPACATEIADVSGNEKWIIEISSVDKRKAKINVITGTQSPTVPLNLKQCLELSLLYTADGNYSEANNYAQQALRLPQVKSDEEKAWLMYVLASNYMLSSKGDEAVKYITLAQRQLEQGKDQCSRGALAIRVAATRLAFTSQSNTLDYLAAKDQMTRTCPDFSLKPTCDPVTATVIGVVICVQTIMAVVVVAVYLTPPEDRKGPVTELVKVIPEMFAALVGMIPMQRVIE